MPSDSEKSDLETEEDSSVKFPRRDSGLMKRTPPQKQNKNHEPELGHNSKKRNNRSPLNDDCKRTHRGNESPVSEPEDMVEDLTNADTEAQSFHSFLSNFKDIIHQIRKRKAMTQPQQDALQDLIVNMIEAHDKVVIENATLRGRYKEQSLIIDKLIQQRNTPTQPTATAQVAGPATYASVASTMAKHHYQMEKNSEKSPTKVFLIYPKDGAEATSEETKELLHRKLNPKVAGLHVKRLSKIRNGGVAIEVPAGQASILQDQKIATEFDLKVPTKRRPKIKIFDLPANATSEDLVEGIHAQNCKDLQDLETFRNEFKPLFKTGKRDQHTTQWVVEVSPKVRNHLLRTGRIFLEWASCKVIDFVILQRCFKCQRIGHLAKDCRARDNICGHCAFPGHTYKECKTKKDKPTCANCYQAKINPNHSVNSNTCPMYVRECQRIQNMTDYG